MKRTGWHAVALSVGLLGVARGDEPTWTASTKPSEKPAVAPVETPKPSVPTPETPTKKSNDETIWRPTSATAAPRLLPPMKGDPGWHATRMPRVVESSTGDFWPPRVIEGELGPRVDRSILPTEFVIEIPLPKVADAAPVMLPEPPPIAPPPRPADKATPQTPPEPNVPKPSPLVIPDSAIPNLRDPAQVPIPAPKPTPLDVKAAPAALPTIVRADDSTAVWGGYSNSLSPSVNSLPMLLGTTICNGDACNPTVIRHGTYGSPSLKLSRDYSLLDACTKPNFGESERKLFHEPEAAPSNCFIEGEYLLWWVNNGEVPVLATTASDHMFGYLGAPTTTLLLGPGSFGSNSPRSGFRLQAGDWFDDCHNCGIDGSFFFLGRQDSSVTLNSTQFPTIARPFYAVNFGREFSELVAFPGVSTGRFVVEQTSFLWGFDVNLRRGICDDPNRHSDWFAGFRNVNLNEALTMTEFITAGAAAPDPAGTTIVVRDRFDVQNHFYGGQLGGFGGWRWGNICLDLRGSVALGVTHQILNIDGNQAKTLPGQATQSFTGGLLAVGPNLGTFTNNEFSVVPEATVALGYQVTSHLKTYLGYNLIGLTNVIRPGDQIDRVIDLTFVPNAPAVPFSGQPRPQPTFRQSDLWIQGVQFGVQGTW